jgi:hypothetical protein
MTKMEDTSLPQEASPLPPSSDISSSQETDELRMFWLEGFSDDGDLYLCEHDLERINELAEERPLSLKRWVVCESGVFSGLGKAICWTEEGQSFKVAVSDKDAVAALKQSILEEEGSVERVKTY